MASLLLSRQQVLLSHLPATLLVAALKMYSSSESNRASTRSFITALNPLELTASVIEPSARLAAHRGSDNGTAAIAILPRCGFITALHLSASIATDPATCHAAP